jgi:hypothetical protein
VGINCTQNRQNEFVDFEAGERLWVGKPPRADSHRTAEPTVGGFAGFREMPESVGQFARAGVDFGVNNPLKSPHNESLMESQNGVYPGKEKICQERLNWMKEKKNSRFTSENPLWMWRGNGIRRIRAVV